MREALVSILAILSVAASVKCTDIGKDGFNFYKDYLRGRSDDVIPEGPPEDRLLYFYRTPLPMYPSLLPVLEQEYRKRTGNAFKNHMLSKEMWDGATPSKRSSKAALSFLMQGKHPYYAVSMGKLQTFASYHNTQHCIWFEGKCFERIDRERKTLLSLRQVGALITFRDDFVGNNVENSIKVE